MGMKMLTGDIREIANTILKQKWVLSDFEVLQIAVKIQQNQILTDAFGITESNKTPKFLEAISMALGYNQNESCYSDIGAAIEYGVDKFSEILIQLKKED